jgi:hypothetical protein
VPPDHVEQFIVGQHAYVQYGTNHSEDWFPAAIHLQNVPYGTPNETINSGSAESSVAAPPAIDIIADEQEDSDDED